MAPSHTDDSSDEEPDAPPAKPRRSRDDLSANEVLPSRTRDAANRQPSRKQASQGKLRAPYKTLLTAIPTDKENMESAEQQLAKLQKQVARMKKQAKQREKAAKGAAPLDDDELESEERSDNEGVVSFASAITPLWRLPPPPPRPTTILRKTKQGDKPAAAKISARAFLRLAESTEQDRNLDEEEPRPENDPSKDLDIGMDVDSDDQRSRARSLERRPSVSADQAHSCHRSGSRSGRRSSPVRPASPHSHSDGRTPRGRSPALDVTSHKRSRPTPNSPPPPAKRSKAPEAKFREGFLLTNAKAKASDYKDVVRAVLLRAMADYTAHILAIDAFPDVGLQMKWAKECWKASCRVSGERYALSERMAKLITKRGSQIRGKTLEAFRSLFASHYGFVRSSGSAAIKSNKALSDKLLADAAFHYKDIDQRKGYASNRILSDVRYLTTFKDKDALGAIFRSYFDPIALPNIALDFAVVRLTSFSIAVTD
ncbi:hypothetical protein B0H10DRAFT_2237109 [Mycena sp. CBHHK59/15]|nr:hypothetical protein B0H10DRAFT_2237109 [Mycena sp. CBHHK59/15]